MIMYLPDPQAVIDGMPFTEMVQIKLKSGGYVNAETVGLNQVRILEVISTDPMDYMNEKYQPGSIINSEF